MRKLILIAFYYGGVLITYVDPFYGVLLYTFMNIVRPEQLAWGDRAFAGRIFLIVQVACFTSWVFNREKLTPEYTPLPLQIKILIVIVIAMLISWVFAISPPSESSKWSTQFMKITLFCFVISKSINTGKKLDWYFIVSLFFLMFLQLWGIQQKAGGGNPFMENIGGDQLSDRNDLGAVSVMYFPASYYMLYNRKKWIKLFIGIPTTIVSVMFILFTESRGAFLGLAVCFLFMFLRAPGVQKMKMIATVITVGILLIAVMVPLAPEGFFDDYTERLKTMLGEEEDFGEEVEYEGSAAGRLAMWKASYHFMRQHPEFWLTGLGPRGFSAVYFQYIDEIEPHLNEVEYYHILYGGRGGKAIHNTYINMATSGGILVFVPWMFLLFVAVIQAHQIPKTYPKIVDGVNIHNYAMAIELGLLGAGASVMFINAEYVDFYYWYITIVGVIANLGSAQIKKEELGLEEEYEAEYETAAPAFTPFSAYR